MKFAPPDRFLVSPDGPRVLHEHDRRGVPRNVPIVETYPDATRLRVYPPTDKRYGPRRSFEIIPRPMLSKTWKQQTHMTRQDGEKVRRAFAYTEWPTFKTSKDDGTVTVEMWTPNGDAGATAWRRLWWARDAARAELAELGYVEVDVIKPWAEPRIAFQYRRNVPALALRSHQQPVLAAERNSHE